MKGHARFDSLTSLAPDPRQALEGLWWTGIDAVLGRRSVATFLSENPMDAPTHILAIGKAAEEMYLGTTDMFGGRSPFLVITKRGHAKTLRGPNIIEAGHPVPDENTLVAGRKAIEFVQGTGAAAHLLVLVSGGASALAEVPEGRLTLADLAAMTSDLLAQGHNIAAINDARKKVSRIKGGKLLSHFRGRRISVLGVSDVEGDAIETIGSGIAAGNLVKPERFRSHIVASNKIARTAIVGAALAAGHTIVGNHEDLYEDVADAASKIGTALRTGAKGIHLWGGEPTVRLPDAPGNGGRNQDLALRLAREIAQVDGVTVLVAGTDGTDGPTSSAGACVDGKTWSLSEGGEEALNRADSGTWLDKHGCLFVTGPTGTNVMDIVVALKA